MRTKATLLSLFAILAAFATMAQGKYGATPEDSTKCIEATSLYSEYYKQKAYADAKPYLVQAIGICPKSSKNLYIKGTKVFKEMIKAASTDEEKASMLDSLMWMYDMRAEHFGQRGYVLGRKGSDLLRYGKAAKSLEAYHILKEGFELSGDDTEAGALAAYYQAAYYSVAQKKLEKEVLLELYPQLNGVLAKRAAEKGELSKAEKRAVQQIDDIFSKVAGCDDLVEIYAPKFEANKTDTATLLQIMALFEKRGCTDRELFLQASIEADKAMTSGISKVAIGAALLKKERYSEAIGFLKDGANIAQNDEVKKRAYLYLGEAQLRVKNYPGAKNAAMKLLQLDPNNGQAYMIIGNAYFYGSSTVGDNACMKKGGVWASIAKFSRAKSLDPSLADAANKKLGQVASQYPSKEDCLFHGITDGQTVTVGGWITDPVTVKTLN
jgi:tetratricopeptide (TPR) repeat protein